MEYNVAGVMFDVTKKRYYFEVKEGEVYKKGEKVIVDTVRGQELGIIYAEPRKMAEETLVLPLKPIIRRATAEDAAKYAELRELSDKALKSCKEKVFEHGLQMKLVGCEYTFDRTKLIFYFTAEGRIDFRNLVKDLAAIFRLRIELRQIGVRDESRILGRIGICGKELCCRSFINRFESVSIKMGRDQGLIINPSKISGCCGRLLCCIGYEQKQYEAELLRFPAVGQKIKSKEGAGTVLNLSPLNGYLYLLIENGAVKKVMLEDIEFDKEEAKRIKRENEQREAHNGEIKQLEDSDVEKKMETNI